MQLGQSAGARSNPLDRSATQNDQGYFSTAVAPHTTTVRWTYTTPSQRLAFVNGASVSIRRETAGTAGARAIAVIQLNSTSATEPHLCVAWTTSNAVDAGNDQSIGSGLFMDGVNTLVAYTADVGVIGTVDYNLYASITEYDQGG